MAATSTPSITSLVSNIRLRYPELGFVLSDYLSWNPNEHTIHYRNDSNTSSFLHEVGHALLCHRSFRRDITLLEMERDAWSKARRLANDLDLSFDEDVAAEHLDTYREWLHARSRCPNCSETGIETTSHLYRCLSCDTSWRVNDARSCALRRYVIKV